MAYQLCELWWAMIYLMIHNLTFYQRNTTIINPFMWLTYHFFCKLMSQLTYFIIYSHQSHSIHWKIIIILSHSIIIHPATTPTISELVDLIIYCLYPCETNISKILDQYLKPFLTYSNLKFEKFHSLTSPKSVINLNTFTWWGLVFLFTIIKAWNLQYYSFKQWRIQICNQIRCKTNSSMKKKISWIWNL